jgi:hypothetical protein
MVCVSGGNVARPPNDHRGGPEESPGRSADARWFAKIPSSFLAFGYLMAAFTRRQQALHDLASGCVVLAGPASEGAMTKAAAAAYR